jgi:carboxyl-terminal processing protease
MFIEPVESLSSIPFRHDKRDDARVPSRFQKSLPAVGVALTLILGCIFFEHDRSVKASGMSDDNRALFNAITQRVEEVYYHPVDTRALVKGERTGILAVVKAHKGAVALVPSVDGTGDASRDNAIMDRTLGGAIGAFAGKIDADSLSKGAIRGMLNALHDPYTTYMTEKEYSSLEESLDGGDFGGVGIYIVQDPHSGEVLIDPIEDSPAARAGLKPGDTIVAIDGRTVRDMKLDNVEHLIRGKVGSTVALLIRSHGTRKAPRVVQVTRAQIHVPSVRAKIEGDIDYIRLAEFGETSGEEVRKAILEGRRRHVRGYILDLRYNGGGLLDAAVSVSSLFIPQGPIVSTIDRFGDKDTKSALGTSLDAKPLAILVNHFSASSSEITAGALEDYHAGTLVGTKTFGKGVVQSLFTLSDRGALKVTTARYVTPAGRDIQHKGILPNIIVDQPDDLRYIDSPRDRQLAAAKALVIRESKK